MQAESVAMSATTSTQSLDAALLAAIEAVESGALPKAAELITKAIESKATPPSAIHTNFATVINAVNRMGAGHYFETIPQVLSLLGEVEQSDYGNRIAWIYTNLATGVSELGDPERGLEWIGKALAMTESRPDSVCRRKALATHASLLGILGHYEPSRVAFRAAIDLADKQSALRPKAISLANLSFSYAEEGWSLGDSEDEERRTELGKLGVESASQALAIADGLGDAYIRAFCLGNRGFGLSLMGQDDAALATLLEAEAMSGTYRHILADIQLGIARSYWQKGGLENSRNWIALAESTARSEHSEIALARILDEGGRMERLARNDAAALDWAQRNIAFLKEHYQRRLRMLARSAEVFAEAEQARRSAMQLKRESQVWEDAALHDTLTGAFNRRGLLQHASRLLRVDAPFALASFDADYFKRINDTFGHAVGDAVLVELTRLIKAHCRENDLFARIGGEEFVLLMTNVGEEAAWSGCERIRYAIETNSWERISNGLAVTVSIGLAVCESTVSAPPALESVIAQADQALYAAKHAGRNRVCKAVS